MGIILYNKLKRYQLPKVLNMADTKPRSKSKEGKPKSPQKDGKQRLEIVRPGTPLFIYR